MIYIVPPAHLARTCYNESHTSISVEMSLGSWLFFSFPLMIFRSVNQPDNSGHHRSLRAAKWTETKKTWRQRPSYPVLSAAAQCLGLEPRAVIRLQWRHGFIQTKAIQLAEGDEETDCLPMKYGLTNGCLKRGVGIFQPQRLGFIYHSVPYPKLNFKK